MCVFDGVVVGCWLSWLSMLVSGVGVWFRCVFSCVMVVNRCVLVSGLSR